MKKCKICYNDMELDAEYPGTIEYKCTKLSIDSRFISHDYQIIINKLNVSNIFRELATVTTHENKRFMLAITDSQYLTDSIINIWNEEDKLWDIVKVLPIMEFERLLNILKIIHFI